MKKLIVAATPILLLVGVWMLFQSTPAPAEEVQVATTTEVEELTSTFEIPICDKTTMSQIQGAYEAQRNSAAREIAEAGLAEGRCSSGSSKFYRTDLYNFGEDADAAKFAIAPCRQTKTGECIALQPVFFYKDGEEESGKRHEGYTLMKQTLTPEGEVADWARLSL